MKSCTDAALAIADIEAIDAQWILNNRMCADDLKTELDDLDTVSRRIRAIAD